MNESRFPVNKIATITMLFWLMKIVATTLGETFGDYLSMTLNLGYTTGILVTAVLFGLLLYNQLQKIVFSPLAFWLVIIATTTLGTEISDFIDRTLNLGYALGSLLLLVGLLLSLLLWYKKYHNLNVTPITDTQKELYFWIAVLF